MTEITQTDRDAAASAYYAWFDGSPVIPTRMKQGQVDHHTMIQAFARHRMEERAAIVAWLRKENGRCDCFAYDDNECACGGRDEYKTWPLEQTANAIEAGEHLK
jgi:hypothetical protein